MSQEISLASTDTLLDEVMKRHEHAVFIGMKTQVQGKSDTLTIRRWHGNFATCAGLCTQAAYFINKDVDQGPDTDHCPEIP